jgi:hypothetical protein
MAELTALRARLKDRQVKEGALGTAETSICLDLELLNEFTELEAERVSIVNEVRFTGDPGSMAGAVKKNPDTTDVDAKIEAKKAEIEQSSLTLVFRAIASVRYQEILNSFDDPDESRSDFMNALCDACLHEVWSDGEKVGGEGVTDGLGWADIHPEMSFGEWDTTTTIVFALNRRKIDAPFSLKPSKRMRNSDATPKPA